MSIKLEPEEVLVKVASEATGAIPVAGPAISLFIELMYEGSQNKVDATPEAIWDAIKNKVKTTVNVIVDSKLQENFRNNLKNKLEGYKWTLESVGKEIKTILEDNENEIITTSTLQRIISLTDTILLDEGMFKNQVENRKLMSLLYFVPWANTALYLLKLRAHYANIIEHPNSGNYEKEYEEKIEEYSDWIDIQKEYAIQWRLNQLTFEKGTRTYPKTESYKTSMGGYSGVSTRTEYRTFTVRTGTCLVNDSFTGETEKRVGDQNDDDQYRSKVNEYKLKIRKETENLINLLVVEPSTIWKNKIKDEPQHIYLASLVYNGKGYEMMGPPEKISAELKKSGVKPFFIFHMLRIFRNNTAYDTLIPVHLYAKTWHNYNYFFLKTEKNKLPTNTGYYDWGLIGYVDSVSRAGENAPVKVFVQHGNEGRYFLSHGTKVMRQVDTSFISDLLEYGVVGETVFKDWTEDPHSLSPGYTFAEKVVFEKDGHYFNFKTGWAVTKS